MACRARTTASIMRGRQPGPALAHSPGMQAARLVVRCWHNTAQHSTAQQRSEAEAEWQRWDGLVKQGGRFSGVITLAASS